jgi:hypothetical protein
LNYPINIFKFPILEVEMENQTSFDSERLRVLRMVEEGKVNATEGITLLEALGQGYKKPKLSSGQFGPAAGGPQWFRIRVTHIASGRTKATVNIPLALAEWGLQIGARFAPEVGDIDLAELSRLLNEKGTEGKIVDVVDEDDGEHVEIFIE